MCSRKFYDYIIPAPEEEEVVFGLRTQCCQIAKAGIPQLVHEFSSNSLYFEKISPNNNIYNPVDKY